MNRRTLNRLQITLICVAMILTLTMPVTAQPASRIVTGTAVRIRHAPNLTAQVVTMLNFGAIVRELQHSKIAETIGDVHEYWYHVVCSDGQHGWIFGGLTRPFDPTQRENIYREIVSTRVANRRALTFPELADFFQFLTNAVETVTQQETKAALEFARLRILQQALEQTRKHPAFMETWVTPHQDMLGYCEFCGHWLVRPKFFWDLYHTYQSLPIADDMAWEAARYSRRDDCEGVIGCHVGRINKGEAQYLVLYPAGTHTSAALQWIIDYLEQLTDLTYHPTPRRRNASEKAQTRAQQEITQLKETVRRTSAPETEVLLDILHQLEVLYPCSMKKEGEKENLTGLLNAYSQLDDKMHTFGGVEG